MSTLAKIRQVPPRTLSETDEIVERVEELYRSARDHDEAAKADRREAEALIRQAYAGVDRRSKAAGELGIRLTDASKLTRQRLYQVLGASDDEPVEDSANGHASEDTGSE